MTLALPETIRGSDLQILTSADWGAGQFTTPPYPALGASLKALTQTTSAGLSYAETITKASDYAFQWGVSNMCLEWWGGISSSLTMVFNGNIIVMDDGAGNPSWNINSDINNALVNWQFRASDGTTVYAQSGLELTGWSPTPLSYHVFNFTNVDQWVGSSPPATLNIDYYRNGIYTSTQSIARAATGKSPRTQARFRMTKPWYRNATNWMGRFAMYRRTLPAAEIYAHYLAMTVT